MKKTRVLVTDTIFPNGFAKWRIEEIKSFIDRYDTDVLAINRPTTLNNFPLNFDYEELKSYCNLHDYNILIFDQQFNHLNQYNTRVDGTAFNGMFKGSYLLTKDVNFNISNYSVVYHIFLLNYTFFNQNYSFDKGQQSIHLYPGGGFLGASSTAAIDRSTYVISTNPNTTCYLNNSQHYNYVEAFGGPMLQPNTIIKHKKKNNSDLTVCFASLGSPASKGYPSYLQIVNMYKQKYPYDDVNFISIGVANNNIGADIKHYKPMPMSKLDRMYYEDVDIYINTEIGKEYNGWPIGGEALLQGCVQLSTDPTNSNQIVKYPSDALIVLDLTDLNEWVDEIKTLYDDRQKLLEMSIKSQAYAKDYYSFEKQQSKIFEQIDKIAKHKTT